MQKSHQRTILQRRMFALLGLALLGLALTTSCSLFQKKGLSTPDQIIGPAGGTLEFADGIQMVVPPNAVIEDTLIQLTTIDPAVIADLMKNALLSLEPLTFFQVSMDGAELQNTVKVILPVSTTDEFIGIPIHVEIDLDTGAVTYPPTDLTYDPDARTIELSLDSFSGHGTGTLPEEMEGPTECENPATACRCGAFTSESRAHDFTDGECQSVSSEIKTQFLDCPGQPIEEDKESERTPECDWKGSVSFHYLIQAEGTEMQINCSDPIPFKIGEDDKLTGSGSMHCVLNHDLGDGGHLDLEYDEEVELSGTFDGFELIFDPPVEKIVHGHIKVWAIFDGSEVSLIDATFDDKSASADMFVFPEGTSFSFLVPIDGEDNDQSAYDFKFPLEDGSVYEVTIPGDGSLATLTLTLDLDIE